MVPIQCLLYYSTSVIRTPSYYGQLLRSPQVQYREVSLYIIVLTILPCTVGDCTAVSDATRGTRCIEIHPLGQHMAAGDRQGNLKYKKNYFRTL